ncbi:hypothetical protein N7504_004130 [Penicillium tannophilum]|nr:hypothetical protein N7504_004130 [Penicillium tannophilum]
MKQDAVDESKICVPRCGDLKLREGRVAFQQTQVVEADWEKANWGRIGEEDLHSLRNNTKC